MQNEPAPLSPPALPTARTKIIILSVLNFLVMITFSSFSAVLVYLHQKYRHKGYGEAYLTANSLTSMVTYIFCAFILEKSSMKSTRVLFYCVVGYLVNLLIPTAFSLLEDVQPEGQTMPEPSTLRFSFELLANAIGGFASSIFGIVSGLYVSQYCNDIPENNRGKLISLFNFISNSRLILAPLITMVGLGMGNQTLYFLLLSCIAAGALPIPLLCIPDIPVKIPQSLDQSQSFNQLQTSTRQQQQKSVFGYVVNFIKYFKQVKFILPASMLSGLTMGFVSSSLSHLLPRPLPGTNNDTNIATCLVFFGLGNLIAGSLSAYLCDKIGIKKASYLGHSVVVLTNITQAICLSMEPSLGSGIIIGFLSGFSYSYIFSIVFVICTIQYRGIPLSNSTNRLVIGLSYLLYQWFVAFLNNRCNMQLNMTYQGLGLIPLAVVSMYLVKLQCDRYVRSLQERQKIQSLEYFSKETNVDTVKTQQN